MQVGDSKLETVSVAETDEPGYSTSDVSDSATEEMERNISASDANWNPNQQVWNETAMKSDIDYFYVAMPFQEHFVGSDFDWAQQHQEATWRTDQGFEDIPVQWFSIDQGVDTENIGFPSTTFGNESNHQVLALSSLIWDVGNDCGSPFISEAQDARPAVVRGALDEGTSLLSAPLLAKTLIASLPMPDSSESGNVLQECMDSPSTVVVKNTFIECRTSSHKGISAVEFRSEKICRRSVSKGKARNGKSRLAELPAPDDAYDTDDGF
jgi:hypothetical protein